MKKFLIIALLTIDFIVTHAQDVPKYKIYDPAANAALQIDSAERIAKKYKKHVLLQIGGNWCIWCMRFHKLVTENDTLRQLLNDNYVVVHINYSPENKNVQTLAKLGYPQRFGFPVFVVLDAEGNRLHTQNSGYLEEGKGHSKKKVEEFLEQWSPAALDPKRYK